MFCFYCLIAWKINQNSNQIRIWSFFNSSATHLIEAEENIRVVQELMGHADVKTNEIYTHVMENDIQAVSSPLETL